MARNKIKKYTETLEYSNIIHAPKEVLFSGWEIKGNWNELLFQNNNEIIAELGAGKGETSLMLAQRYPEKNFICIDIKGDRLLKGAKEAIDLRLNNILFLRMQIEHITMAFEKDEISEIWITFPDPFPTDRQAKKRMTSPIFLMRYKDVLKNNGIIHLKTDSTLMYDFTKETITNLQQKLVYDSANVYLEEDAPQDVTKIQTYYERKWLLEGRIIKYVAFKLQ